MTEMSATPTDGETDGSKQIVVLHIPHSSRHVPNEERQTILLDNAALAIELLRMTDAYTDELFPVTPFEAGRVVFPVSRLVCDVERSRPTKTSRWQRAGWVCFTPGLRWATCFGR